MPANDISAPAGAGAPALGTKDLLVLYLTSLIGAGILVIPGITAQRAGPVSLLAWVVLGVGSFAMAHLFARMATLDPTAGGLCTYIGRNLGRVFGDTALMVLVAIYVIGNPVLGVISGRYLVHLLGVGPEWVLPAGAGFMMLSVGFNLIGAKTGARVQRIAFIGLLLCLGTAIVIAVPSMSPDRLTPLAPNGWGELGGAAVVAFFAFLGWENVLLVAKEVREPRRAFRIAIAVAVPVVGLAYLITTFAYLAVPATGEAIVLPALLGDALGRTSVIIADLIAIAVLMVATNAWVFGASRVVMSAARRGLLPRSMDKTRGTSGTPVRALVWLAVGYLLAIGVMALFQLTEEPMLLFVSATFLVLYIGVSVAALRSRPPRALQVSAAVTLLLVAVFLPSTALALPMALLLFAAMAVVAIVRSPVVASYQAAKEGQV